MGSKECREKEKEKNNYKLSVEVKRELQITKLEHMQICLI